MIVQQSLEIPLYNRRLHIVICSDFLKDFIEINKKYGQNFTAEDDVLGMAARRAGDHLVIINIGRHRKYYKGVRLEEEIANTVAHEATHVCNMLFTAIGATVEQTNDEPQAYLIGWIVKQVTRNYFKLKEKETI